MSRSKQARVQSCQAGKHYVTKAEAIAAFGPNVESCDRCRGWKPAKRKKTSANHNYRRGRGDRKL